MTELNEPHAVWLVFIATVMGMLGLYGRRVARGMVEAPEMYQRKLLEKRWIHPLAMRWMRPGSVDTIRSWGIGLSRLAFGYAVFSFATVGVISILIVMDCVGFESAVGPVVKLLSKLEADLAC